MEANTPNRATIDGTVVAVVEGETILQGARRAGIEIPTLCYADHLTPEGGCRMCLVRKEGAARPVAACHTGLQPGMVIQTRTPELEAVRKTLLSLYSDSALATGFRIETVRTGRFHELAHQYGLNGQTPDLAEQEDSHPYLRFNPAACITCRLCLNACEQVQGRFVYGVESRGPASRLLVGGTDAFADSPCVACGACVDVCPTGAVTDCDRLEPEPAASSSTQSVCGYCGVGCRIEVVSSQGRVRRISGVREAEVNHGHLCAKGRFGHSYQASPERLTRPLMRDGDTFREVSWDEALRFIAERLLKIRSESGPDALGGFASSRSTNEACYLLQKLFRGVIGTNNIDCCARVCHSSTALALQTVTGTGAATASYRDIDRASLIVVAGANPTEAHPVIGARIKQRVMRGAPLIVIDPRRIELAEYADVHLRVAPGGNVALFNGLTKILIEEGLVDEGYVRGRTEGFEALCQFVETLTLERVAAVTGVAEADLRKAARLIGAAGPALFVHGLGLSELMQGVHSVITLCNLGMLTGSIGRPGAGMLPLRGQNNVQGGADMGCMPAQLTGYQSVVDPAVRAHVASVWGALPEAGPGLTSIMMLRAAAAGNLRGLWLMGEDVVQSDPHEAEVVRAMERLDLVIVQDLFFSETARYAHVILPAAACLEQDGTFTNGERRVQLVRSAVPPPGEARPDWEAVAQVARRMGAAWNYAGPADVMAEIARVAPRLFGGVIYERLGGDGLQWPCPVPGHPGTATIHAEHFPRGRGRLVCVDYQPSPEHGVDGFPYLLITGRILEHYNVGTMTRRTALSELVSRDVLEVNPADAIRERIMDGGLVRVSSRWGEITVPAAHSPRTAPGTLFLTFHFPETHANRLTGPTVDPDSNCPQYKATAVRLRAA